MSRPARVRSPGPAVEVRPIRTLEEYRRCMALQQAAFGYEDLFVEPLTQLITAQRYGGLVLGAFDGAGALVGYLYSCLGRRDGELVQCFRLLAVSPEARGLGVGERLLFALRAHTVGAGVRTIVATFDPLEASNARLYLGKIGFRGLRYLPNHYGDLGRGQNEGLETDRLEIEWGLAPADRVARAAAVRPALRPGAGAGDSTAGPSRALPRITVTTRQGDWPACTILRLDLEAERLRLEIPRSLQALKAADRALALAWRSWTREAFLAYVGSGRYAAVDFLAAPDDRSEPAYVLERVARP